MHANARAKHPCTRLPGLLECLNRLLLANCDQTMKSHAGSNLSSFAENCQAPITGLGKGGSGELAYMAMLAIPRAEAGDHRR